MNRQSAFTGSGKLLKGGLHCHTTRSDGSGTPEEVIRMHVDHGYDFLALTDHRYYNYKNYTDLPITIIPGMEMDRGFTKDEGLNTSHCFHSVCIGPEKNDGNGYEQDQRFDGGRVKDQFEYQKVLDDIHAHGNLTTLCHPQWSATPAKDFGRLKGIFAMELWNSGCVMNSDSDVDNSLIWDELLIDGKCIYGMATDDGHWMVHHCNGWVMVNSANNVRAILTALEHGAFYSSTGPEISDFYIDDDNTAHITCSPCEHITFYNGYTTPKCKRADPGKTITEATFNVQPYSAYVRACVTGADGKKAWTNPIFLDGRA